MRIGYVHSTGFPSLDANVVQVVQMCRSYSRLGHEVTLFIPRADDLTSNEAAAEKTSELFGPLPFRVAFVPRVRLFGRMEVIGSVAGTIKAIQQLPLDLVYTRNPWSVVFLPGAGKPYVFEAHAERMHATSPILNRYLRSQIVKHSRQPACKMVVSISHALMKTWEGFGVPVEKSFAAHDGVELELFGHSLPQAEARAKLSALHSNLPTDKHRPWVVYTGALRDDRGMDLVLECARELTDLEFFLVGGKDNEIAKWRGEIARIQLTNVHLPGRVPHQQIPLWLAASDIQLMMWTWKVPTIRGCSPMKMFEYMAAERLIVGPAFPTVCEVLENGKDSILFEPDDLPDMKRALREAVQRLNDPSLPRAARVKVERDYTWEARCRQILAALSERGFQV